MKYRYYFFNLTLQIGCKLKSGYKRKSLVILLSQIPYIWFCKASKLSQRLRWSKLLIEKHIRDGNLGLQKIESEEQMQCAHCMKPATDVPGKKLKTCGRCTGGLVLWTWMSVRRVEGRSQDRLCQAECFNGSRITLSWRGIVYHSCLWRMLGRE